MSREKVRGGNMTFEEIQQHYPGAPRAVYLFTVSPEMSTLLERCRDLNESPDSFVRGLCIALLTSLTEGETVAGEILAQVSHPDFLKYIRAKFGCM
jgi:hypothetical protein